MTNPELAQLADFLRQCKGGQAMNVEELDGFFAALVAGPETVFPSEYYPHIFGGTMEEACQFDNLDQVNAVLGWLSRHWNTIAGTLYADESIMGTFASQARKTKGSHLRKPLNV